jgi:hypothetical protein
MAAGGPLHTFASKVLTPGGNDMKQIVTKTRVLVASGVVAVTLLAACGSDGPGKATSTAAPGQVDAPAAARHAAQAGQYERLAHLQGQARTYGIPGEHQDPVTLDSREARSRALAESLERSAQLEGQARTHGKADSSDDAPALTDETSDDEFVPGSRHMPMR